MMDKIFDGASKRRRQRMATDCENVQGTATRVTILSQGWAGDGKLGWLLNWLIRSFLEVKFIINAAVVGWMAVLNKSSDKSLWSDQRVEDKARRLLPRKHPTMTNLISRIVVVAVPLLLLLLVFTYLRYIINSTSTSTWYSWERLRMGWVSLTGDDDDRDFGQFLCHVCKEEFHKQVPCAQPANQTPLMALLSIRLFVSCVTRAFLRLPGII